MFHVYYITWILAQLVFLALWIWLLHGKSYIKEYGAQGYYYRRRHLSRLEITINVIICCIPMVGGAYILVRIVIDLLDLLANPSVLYKGRKSKIREWLGKDIYRQQEYWP